MSELLHDYGAELVLHGHGHRAHYNELDTRAGTLPIISVPSASALGLHGADVAGYNRYTVARVSGGWELQVAARQYARDTGEFDAGMSRTVRLARH